MLISNGRDRPVTRKLKCSDMSVITEMCAESYGERASECGRETEEEGSIFEYLSCSEPCARDLYESSYSIFKKFCKKDVEQCPHLPNKTKKEVTCQHQRIWWSTWACWLQSPCTFSLSCLLGGFTGNLQQVMLCTDHSDSASFQ